MMRLAILGMSLLLGSAFATACGDDESDDKDDGVKIDAPGVDVKADALNTAGRGATERAK